MNRRRFWSHSKIGVVQFLFFFKGIEKRVWGIGLIFFLLEEAMECLKF